ncbi:MAG: isopentenyl transferase family protein, partial [Bacilli bacterium]
MDRVICIVGATGVGKTKLSIALGKLLNTEIINGDAIQVFKEVNILSAKIKPEEMDGLKHHLIDLNEIDEYYDVAQFKKDATALIKKINQENKRPI